VTAQETCRRSSDGKLYLRDFSPVHLARVIFGWRVSAKDHSALRDDLKHVNPNARLISAILDGGRVILSPPLR
jgi:hypothetical protein